MRLDPLEYEIRAHEQKKIEEEMIAASRSRFLEKVETSLKEGSVGDQTWARKLVKQWLMPIKEAIDEYVECRRNRRGPKPYLLKYTEVLDSEVLALITVREILHKAPQTEHRSSLLKVAAGIGNAVVDELAVQQMAEDMDPKFYAKLEKQAARAGKRRASRMKAAALKAGYLGDVDKGELVSMGATLIDLAATNTGMVEYRMVYDSNRDTTTRYVKLTLEAHAELEEHVERMAHSPELSMWPMVVPPKEWGPRKKGGYLSEPVRRKYALIGTRNKKEHKGGRVTHDKAVYHAINRIQDTPYQVNTDVLDVIEAMQAAGVEPPKMQSPCKVATPEPPIVEQDAEGNLRVIASTGETFSQGTDGWNTVWKNYYRFREQAQELQDKLSGNLAEARKAIAIAQLFRNYQKIYFPHRADFRGRLYPLPAGLSPQGGKVSQGLLRLGDAKPVGPRGYYWLHVHAANTYGFDKCAYDERVAWAVNNTVKMLEVANDPLGTVDFWGEADKPYQFLAVCLEWPGLTEHMERHESRIAVQKDGSCNGLQHLSAISKDPATAKLVNLSPSDEPSDVYGVVADATSSALTDILNQYSEQEDIDMTNAWLAYGIDRKLAKRPVMTLPYGSTFFAVGEFIIEAVLDRLGIGGDHPFPGTIKEATTWLKKPLWDSIRQTIPGARSTMDWLQGSVKAAAKANLPVEWSTPDGFNVIQSYMKDKNRRLQLKTTGTTLSIWIRDTEDEIDPRKQRNGIAPNFVHSLDACHMRMYVNKAHDAGLNAHVMIHDSFGTHAADVDTMDRLIREAFIEMYEQDVTKSLLDSLEAQGTPYEEPLEIGSFDIQQVANSAYFFG